MNDLPQPTLGDQGDPCPACDSPLGSDQRYCLNCGRRRADTRVLYTEMLTGRSADEVLPAEEVEELPPRRFSGPPVTVAAAAGGAFLVSLGVLLGTLGGNDEPVRVASAPAPQKPANIVVNTSGQGGGSGAGGGETAATEEFKSDWPEGKNGYTVQLQALSKDDVAAVNSAKSDAEGKGAKDVGALDSDEYTSLKEGQYVVYSGVFTGKDAKKKAGAAFKGLKKKFKDAKVVQVGVDDLGAKGETKEEKVKKVDKKVLEDLENATGEEQQKKSAKLPDTLQAPGKLPPKEKEKTSGKEIE